MPDRWRYPHQDLGEPLHADGSPIRPPVYEIPLSVAGGFQRTPEFQVELQLRSSSVGVDEPVRWSLPLGARRGWRLPFAVLLGQRGWFDTFRTTIDAFASVVELPEPAEA